jgi:predicted Zn-ribbon and HTH transcriptional regulator
MRCPRCQSNKIHRLRREGFVEQKLAPLFGYFPWRCPDCKAELLLRVRNQHGVELSRPHRRP